MCGDGTNDVGALKAAHVGVSIVNDPDFEKRIEEAKDPSVQSAPGGKKAKGTNAKERLARAMAEVQAQEIDPTIVKLGDASIASPFTARRTSVDCVLTVMRQGRCTLVTTIQVWYICVAAKCVVLPFLMTANCSASFYAALHFITSNSMTITYYITSLRTALHHNILFDTIVTRLAFVPKPSI